MGMREVMSFQRGVGKLRVNGNLADDVDQRHTLHFYDKTINIDIS